MRIEFHAEAAAELFEAKQWYDKQSESLGVRFFNEIDHAIITIQAAPLRWSLYKNDIHRFHIRRFPYSIIYRVNDNRIQIIAVMHQKRRPFYWKQRTENTI